MSAPSSTAASLPPAPSLGHVPLPPDYERALTQPIPKAVVLKATDVLEPATTVIATAPSIPEVRSNPIVTLWRRLGIGSLAFSIAIHAGVFLAAGLVIFNQTLTERNVDFLPGGGTAQGDQASKNLAHQVQQKRRSTIARNVPLQRVVVDGASAISLPDAPASLLDIPDVSSTFSGGMMGSSGFGKGGAGGGFGDGIGTGGLSGVVFKPVMMFGLELKDTKKIAVVMDVSRSMTKYLPLVAKELDKIARQSVLVLYFGCGLTEPKGRIDDKVRPTTGDEFASFWQHWQGKEDMEELRKNVKKLEYDASKPMPLEDLYKRISGRANTHFINFNGINHTQDAIVCREVIEADTIYWFSDFQDAVNEKVMESVRRKLKARKQKLYMHASVRGKSFDQVREVLCLPSGGEVIEAKVE